MYRVDEAICTGCGACVDACPSGAITLANGKAQIDEAICVDCAVCADACPQGAIVMAGVALPVHAAASVSAIAPARGVDLLRQPEVEIAAAASRGRQFWPMVGGALIWVSRELLPEVIASWQASRVVVSRRTDRRLSASRRRLATHQWNGRRHRWGRA